MESRELIERLKKHRTVGEAPEEELAWIAAHGTYRLFPAGQVIAFETEVINELYILLSGRVSIWVNRSVGRRKFMSWGGGDVTGLLPYSRLRHPPGNTYADEEVEAIAIERELLPEMTRNCHQITTLLVHAMTDRARQFTSGDLRDEKLVSLGKLAAGLAHELNNPASAVLRAARSMTEALATAGNSASGLIAARLTDIQLGELERVRTLAMHTATDRGESGLALADREEALAGWIAAHGASEETAPELAHTSITIDALNRLAGVVRGVQLETSLRFLAAHHTVHSLAIDLERAATRIHQLVSAVKRFTHMDRDLDQGPVDIPSGLADTVALLDGKARSRSVTIDLKVDSSLPPALGVSAEINQIWMNLVDNAIDALSPGGRVAIHASAEHPMIIVEVEDNGSGIPEELVGRIFDPFFTTKEVGEGTGLGLDIVRRIIDRHAGSIDVTSRPGRTLFRVALPAHP